MAEDVICQYCNSKAILCSDDIVYGKKYGMIYLCNQYPKCDAYIGVHEGTKKPKGSLANKELRNLRIKAHYYFDNLWKKKIAKNNMLGLKVINGYLKI